MTIGDGVVVTVTIGLFFFVALPGSGAFWVRRRWRRFRRALLEARSAPPLRYGAVHHHFEKPGDRGASENGPGADEAPAQRRGPYHFFGRLEAIQADHTIWVGDPTLSVMVDLNDVPVYILAPSHGELDHPSDETPRVLFWKDIPALAEGTHVFVAGTTRNRRGSICFDGGLDGVPLVIIYDCPEVEFFRRAIWSGRQRNEYWNQLTPISLIGGFVAETLWALTLVDESRLQAMVALIAALVPVLPLLPPGIVGFYVYRRVWRGARRIRARRDVALIQQSHPPLPIRPAIRGPMSRKASRRELAAVAFLIIGMAVNGYLLAALTALVIA